MMVAPADGLLERLIALALVAALGLIAVPGVHAEERAPGDPPLTVAPLAPGLWLHTSTRAYRGVRYPSNGLIVEGDDSVALVDTGWTDTDTRELLVWIADEIGKPISDVVITHFHDDRLGGLDLIIGGDVTVHAHALTGEYVDPGALGENPTLFTDEHRVERPGLAITAFYPGPGHTRDNIVAYLPGQRVVFAGCLVHPVSFTNLGNTADADIPRWADSAEAVGVRFPDATVLVPSHGAPGDLSLLQHTASMARAAMNAD